jgi:activating signal cointegrator complex subunit 1
MHLTLGVMALSDEPSLSRARELLRQVKLSEHLRAARGGRDTTESQGPLKITLRGLHALYNPASTSVVYAPPEDDESGTLYKFCKGVRGEFERAGLVNEEKDKPLLLHATVVNTIYVPGQRGARGKKERMTLDARAMLDAYDGFVWIEGVEVEKVTLCKMGAKKVEGDDEERYEVIEEVRF